jgi:hypothetical protein
MLKGDSPGVSPATNWDPALSAKVTTGVLSVLASRWKVSCHLLWIDGSQPPVCDKVKVEYNLRVS